VLMLTQTGRGENRFDEGSGPKPHAGNAAAASKGANVNLQDSAGATALMWAVHRGYGGLSGCAEAGADGLKTEVATRL